MNLLSGIIATLVSFFSCVPEQQKSIVIVSASYNNAAFYKENLLSVFNQDYDNWHLYYIDDCSTDGTGKLVQEFIDEHKMRDKVTLILNKTRQRHLYNQYHAIARCKNDQIIAILDADDHFAHKHVLSHLNHVYEDPEIWLTYGQYRYSSGKPGKAAPLSDKMIANNCIRHFKNWTATHLRSFYAGLFKCIKEEDLLFNGRFFPRCADISTMVPMIEMAGEHAKFIPDVLYVYNDENPIQQLPEEKQLTITCLAEIRKRSNYHRLEIAPYLSR